LRDYFAYFGSIKDARIITDPTGVSRGFGFVTFENEMDAAKVLALKEQDFIFKDTKLNVAQAFRNNNNQNQQFGQGGGQFGGRGMFNQQQGVFNNGGVGFQQRRNNNPRFNQVP
jgi:RNA recognition motif-containing protein